MSERIDNYGRNSASARQSSPSSDRNSPSPSRYIRGEDFGSHERSPTRNDFYNGYGGQEKLEHSSKEVEFTENGVLT